MPSKKTQKVKRVSVVLTEDAQKAHDRMGRLLTSRAIVSSAIMLLEEMNSAQKMQWLTWAMHNKGQKKPIIKIDIENQRVFDKENRQKG